MHYKNKREKEKRDSVEEEFVQTDRPARGRMAQDRQALCAKPASRACVVGATWLQVPASVYKPPVESFDRTVFLQTVGAFLLR